MDCRHVLHSLGTVSSDPASRDCSSAALTPAGGVPADDTVFCVGDTVLDAEFRVLHEQLRLGREDAQLEIDRRLHACAAADGGWARHPVFGRLPISWLYTAREDTIQFRRLPDLMRFLSNSVLRQRWTGSLFDVLFHNSLPCLKRGRLLPLPTTNDPGATVACVNVLHGTLLGLYPTCAKHPVFHVRRALVVGLRVVATASPEARVQFLESVPHLVRLCFLEYTLNVTHEFCPQEIEAYVQPRPLASFVGAVANVCDYFRTDALQTTVLTWSRLEAVAQQCLERFARTCRMRATRVPVVGTVAARRVLAAWRKSELHQPRRYEVLATALEQPKTTLAGGLRALVAGETEAGGTLAAVVEALQTNVSTHALPRNLVAASAAALRNAIARDPYRVHCASKLHACMWCLNRPTGNPLAQRLRLDTETRSLSCATCGPGAPVIRINLLGRLLRVGDSYFYFCAKCRSVHVWGGAGTEFGEGPCTRAGRAPESVPPAPHDQTLPLFERHNRTRFGTRTHRRDFGTCLCCENAAAPHYVCVLHVPWRRFVVLFFCGRHTVSAHMRRFVVDTQTLRDLLISRVAGRVAGP